MKKGFYTLGSLIILLIAAVVFVLLPAMLGRGGGKRLPPFGRYDGHEIRYEQGSVFANYVSNYADMLKSRGQDVDTQSYFYVFNYAFNATVQKMAFDEAVKKSHYVVPDEAVDRMMLPYFSENGVYSPKLYRQASNETIQKMREDFTDTLTASRYSDDMLGGSDSVGGDALYGLKATSSVVRSIQDMGSEKRALSVVAFNMSDYPDSEKVEYGKSHSDKFKHYTMSVITCDDKSTAQQVAGRLANNEVSFEDAVGEYSKKSYSDENGKLNSVYRYQLEKTLDEDGMSCVDALETGKVSGVLETSGTWSIFRADAAPYTPDFTEDSVVRDVYNYLNTYEVSIIEDYFTDKARHFAQAAAASSFEEAAQNEGISSSEVSPFALNYGNTDLMSKLDTSVAGLDGADTNEEFLRTVFQLKEGEVSSPVINGRNVLVMLLTGIEKEDMPPTEGAIKDEVANINRSSINSSLMASSKLENNLISVFFNNFLNNDADKE